MNLEKSNQFKIIILLLITVLFGFAQNIQAQKNSNEPQDTHFLQLSHVPGFSTSDSYSTSRLSINFIGGYNGAFRGFEFGSVFNGNRYDVRGLQASGVVNVNQQKAEGVVLAGLVNYSNSFNGWNTSGLVNINRKNAKGVLLSGLFNYTGSFRNGALISGLANVSGHNARGILVSGWTNTLAIQEKGLMLAGILNLSKEAHGISISPVNLTQQLSGLQFGVVNISDNHSGTQIGVVNIVSGESNGTSLGLLNFVNRGRFNLDVWGNETGFVNGGFRFGTESIYNVISVGYNPIHGNNLWNIGIGIGYHNEIDDKGNGIETDLIHYDINHNGKWTNDMSMHTQWRFHYTRSFSDELSLFTGPNINLSILDEDLSSSHVPYSFHQHESGNNQFRWWAGWSLGFELF